MILYRVDVLIYDGGEPTVCWWPTKALALKDAALIRKTRRAVHGPDHKFIVRVHAIEASAAKLRLCDLLNVAWSNIEAVAQDFPSLKLESK